MLGYLDDDAKTARTRSVAAGSTPATLGTTTEHGLLHVVDRKKDMIKTGGENVASREVEEVLYRHDAIEEAAVFGLRASGMGGGGGRRGGSTQCRTPT